MGEDPSAIREEIEESRGRMGDTIEALGHKADVKSRAKESVSEKVDSVKSKFGGATGKVSESTPSGEDVKQGARQAAGIAKENPVGLALGGVALGFLAGLALPSTRVEDEKLGPVSTQVKDQAMETGQEALERGKDVAQQAVQSAKETAQQSAQEHGEELKQSAQQKADETKQEVSS